jgi:hypothetical protein
VVHRRQGGVSGETEESLFVLLSFDFVFPQQSDVRIEFILSELLCRIHYFVTGVKLMGMWQEGGS